jgi:hypothetical protein
MSEINHVALAKTFGARLSSVVKPGFGGFATLGTVGLAEVLKPVEKDRVDPEEDVLVAKAFEETRSGLAPDVVLSNPPLKKKFIERCRQFGVEASSVAISRRLLGYRKSPIPGIKLSETTAESDANPRPYLHAAEFAYIQTKYRFGVSIDDLMVYDDAAVYFVTLAERITPGGRAFDYITAALYLRKTRNFKKDEAEILRKIQTADVEPRFRTVSTMDSLKVENIPEKEGIFLFSEKTASKDRPLYIGSDVNIRNGVEPFLDLSPFKSVANHFWHPRPETITLRIAALHDFEGIPTRSWALKLIHDREPLYNLPVHLKAA